MAHATLGEVARLPERTRLLGRRPLELLIMVVARCWVEVLARQQRRAHIDKGLIAGQ